MTGTAKVGIVLVIILAIIVCAWIWVNQSNLSIEKSLQEVKTQEQAIATPTPTPKIPNTAGTGMSEISDNTNEGIQTDIDAVGKQLIELGPDTAGIDYGINIK